MKKTLKLFSYSVLGFISIIILYILVSVVLSSIPVNTKTKGNNTIYAHSNGVHTDIIIPTEKLNQHFRKQLHLNLNIQFVAFGWGDKGFYLDTPEWKDLKVSTAINAIVLPSATAMHVTYHIQIQPHWKTVSINDEQLDVLIQYIQSSFKWKNESTIPITGYTYGKNDLFFEATGSYSCFKTCNTWTNTGLKKAKIRTALWTPFDWGVMQYLNSK